MGKFRKGKVHFYEQGLVPQDTAKPELSGIGGYVFDALSSGMFLATPSVIIASSVSGTIYDALVVPQRSVIVKVSIIVNAGAAAAVTDAFDVVKGTGARTASAGTAQTVQAAGNGLFATMQALSAVATSTNYQAFNFVPDQPEAFYDTGDVLTLRITTSAAAGTHYTPPVAGANPNTGAWWGVKVMLLMAPIDPKPYAPRVGDSGSLTGADPSADF